VLYDVYNYRYNVYKEICKNNLRGCGKMKDMLHRGFLLGLGALTLTREKTEEVVEDLVKKGELTQEEAKKVIEETIEKGKEQRSVIRESVKKELEDLKKELNLVTKKDLEEFEARITKILEERLGEK